MRLHWDVKVESEINDLYEHTLGDYHSPSHLLIVFEDTQGRKADKRQSSYLLRLHDELSRTMSFITSITFKIDNIAVDKKDMSAAQIVGYLELLKQQIGVVFEDEYFENNENWLLFLNNLAQRIKKITDTIDEEGLLK